MARLIFHLNTLADPAMIRHLSQIGIARFLAERYGKEERWLKAYSIILADWNSYHTDLNFSGEEGMADMREARFRIMRALFRLSCVDEPPQEEIHRLADVALSKAYQEGDIFFNDSHELLNALAEKHSISLVSYFPQVQLEAMVRASHLQAEIQRFIGADTFEQYEMNRHYFEMLLLSLKANPQECFYIDKAPQILEAASEVGIKIFAVAPHQPCKTWSQELIDFIAKECHEPRIL